MDQQARVGLVVAAGLTRKCPQGRGWWGMGARVPQLPGSLGRGLPALERVAGWGPPSYPAVFGCCLRVSNTAG